MTVTLAIPRALREPGPVLWAIGGARARLVRRASALRCRCPIRFEAPGGRALHEFACRVRDPGPRADWPRALVAAAGRLARARRVELLLDDAQGRSPRVAARWPDDPTAPAADGSYLAGRMLAVPLRFGGRSRGILRLDLGPRGRSRGVLRRLETLATLAAAAAVTSDQDHDGGDPATRDPITGVHNEPFLDAYLAHALPMARRRGEPLTLLHLGVEGLEAARSRHGDALSDAALRRLARVVVGTLRASDVVARVGFGGAGDLVVVLPAAPAGSAPRVAWALRRAVAESGITSSLVPPLAVTFGSATYPDDADTPAALRAAAVAAHARARTE